MAEKSLITCAKKANHPWREMVMAKGKAKSNYRGQRLAEARKKLITGEKAVNKRRKVR